MSRNCFALLGRRDEPTDAVEEYCRYLGAALADEGWNLRMERVPWFEQGWSRVLRDLVAEPAKWRGGWIFLQYTALAWSSRAVPCQLPRLIRTLKQVGARCAVVFHDAQPYTGSGLVQKARRMTQIRIMRRLCSLADLSILTIPTQQVPWLPQRGRFVFVPVGANLPNPERAWVRPAGPRDSVPTLAMFSPTGGASGEAEARLAARSLLEVSRKLGPLRLVVLGRNSEEVGARVREHLSGEQGISVEILGLASSEQIVSQLSRVDALLFIRSALSTRRGSGIAGIACGLPLIALEGEETAGPIREAGVLFVSKPDAEEFASALIRLFTEPGLRETLAESSRNAQRTHFSWPAIAKRIATELQNAP